MKYQCLFFNHLLKIEKMIKEAQRIKHTLELPVD